LAAVPTLIAKGGANLLSNRIGKKQSLSFLVFRSGWKIGNSEPSDNRATTWDVTIGRSGRSNPLLPRRTDMKIIIALLALGVASNAIASAKALSSPNGDGDRISIEQAREIALKIAPGKIQDEEYEREGKAWRYSFDIVEGRRIHEIGVDAHSGQVVEDKYEARGSKD
jgi:hypothetical protein